MNDIINESLIIEVVTKKYCKTNDKIIKIKKVKEGHNINSINYYLEILANGNVLKRILKVKFNYSKRDFKILILTNYLYKKKNKVSKIINTNTQEIFVTKNNKLFVLFKYYSKDNFHRTSQEICSAAKNLALLNKSLNCCGTNIKRSFKYDNLTDVEIDEIKNKVISQNNFNKKTDVLLKEISTFYDKLRFVLNDLSISKQLVHMDYHLDNILFKNKEVNVILDMDSIVKGFHLQSVAFALDRICNTDKEKSLFIKTYQNVNFISKREIKLIPYFIQLEALARINYILREHYFYNNILWDFELKKHLKIIRKIENEMSNLNYIF
jgi:hypothetical protein